MRSFLLLLFGPCCLGQFYSPFNLNNDDAAATVKLTLNQGTITGLRFDGFDAYRGVRYAKPPGRFEHAEMIETFFNADARNFGPTCFQQVGFSFAGLEDPTKNMSDFYREGLISEDCLTLDIYIPHHTSDDTNRGILFWIHGGGYYAGDSRMYTGVEHALGEGNVVVIIQYRLGVFGFLNAYDTVAKRSIGGNYGLSDASLALDFIHQNAPNLNARQDGIIVNGESAGAGMIMALLLHDATASKISGAFVQSGGTSFNFFTSVDSPARPFTANSASINNYIAEFFCALIATCDTTDVIVDQVWNGLKQADPVELFSLDLRNQATTTFGWTPISRDDHFYNKGDVKVKYERGEVETRVNLVIGFNSHEASLVRPLIDTVLAESTVDEMIAFLNYGFGLFSFVNDLNVVKGTDLTLQDHYDELLEQFQSFSRHDNLTQADIRFLASELGGSVLINAAGVMDAITYSRAGAKVWVYYFDFEAPGALDKFAPYDDVGLSHAAELPYNFGGFKQRAYEPWEPVVADFINGKIGQLMECCHNHDLWEQFTEDEPAYLRLGNTRNGITKRTIRGDPLLARSERAIGYWQANSSSAMTMSIHALTVVFLYLSL